MSKTTRPYNEIDDYVAAFSYEERQEYAAAETALNLIISLYRIRKEQGTRRQHDAERAGVKRHKPSAIWGKQRPLCNSERSNPTWEL